MEKDDDVQTRRLLGKSDLEVTSWPPAEPPTKSVVLRVRHSADDTLRVTRGIYEGEPTAIFCTGPRQCTMNAEDFRAFARAVIALFDDESLTSEEG